MLCTEAYSKENKIKRYLSVNSQTTVVNFVVIFLLLLLFVTMEITVVARGIIIRCYGRGGFGLVRFYGNSGDPIRYPIYVILLLLLVGCYGNKPRM